MIQKNILRSSPAAEGLKEGIDLNLGVDHDKKFLSLSWFLIIEPILFQENEVIVCKTPGPATPSSCG